MAEAEVTTCGALAGYFDILGQSDALHELRTMEERFGSEEYERKALVIVHKIRIARMYFRKAFASDGPNRASSMPEAQLTAEERAEFARLRARVIHGSYFADSFLMMAPLLDSDIRYYLLTVHRFLLAAAACQLQCLAAGIPIRGGIVIGAGFRVKEADEQEPYFYGPILIDAHYLESQVASYPRIVLGNRLVRELGLFRRADPAIIPEGTAAGVVSFAQELSSSCLDLVRPDPDQNVQLDLRAGSLQGLLGGALHERAIRSARAFASDEWKRHITARDQVVAAKYALLLHSLTSASPPPVE